MAIITPHSYTYVGDGVTTQFPIAFQYVKTTEVEVYVDSKLTPHSISTGFVVLSPSPTLGAVVEVRRNTDARSPMHRFAHGSPLLPAYLDGNFQQSLHTVQEYTYTSMQLFAKVDATNAAQDALIRGLQSQVGSGGYDFSAGGYAAGITLTQYNQVVRDSSGELWRASGTTPLPYTLTGVGVPENGALVSVGDAALRQDLANPHKGATMVGFTQRGAASISRTVSDKLRETVSVIDKGASTDGVTDSTNAFLLASVDSSYVLVPPSDRPYVINGLNVDYGVKFYGAGQIKTPSGNVVDLSAVSMEYDNGPMKLMFLEGSSGGWEELLDIKATGYNTILAYPWYLNIDSLVKNCESVGLRIIIHARLGPPVPEAIVPNMTWDDRESVIGYYIFDEPVIHGVSVADQNRAIAAYRAVTKKPLFCTENAGIADAGLISGSYDVVLVDVYYHNSFTSANTAIHQYISCVAEYGAAGSMKILPCVGLFNDVQFGKSEELTIALANYLLDFSPDGSFGVFIWASGKNNDTRGVRNTPAYRKCARDLATKSGRSKPIVVDTVSIGTSLGSMNALLNKYVNLTDGGIPGEVGASPLVPWYVENVGSAIDTRRQTFEASGLMVRNSGGKIGFSNTPSGICVCFLRYVNRENGEGATISVGASVNGGYGVGVKRTETIASGGTISFGQELSDRVGDLPVLSVTLPSNVNAPFCFIWGYMAFTDARKVDF